MSDDKRQAPDFGGLIEEFHETGDGRRGVLHLAGEVGSQYRPGHHAGGDGSGSSRRRLYSWQSPR